MGRIDAFEDQVDGQMSIWDLCAPQDRLFAVSRIFARARKEMSLAEQKTFVYALSELKFTEEAKSNIVYLDKKILAKLIGINADINHLSVKLHEKIQHIARHSEIHFDKSDIGLYDDGQLITRSTILKNRVRIKFEEEYLPLFTGLSKNYITLWSGDIFQMQSSRSVQFYEYLRQRTDTRLDVNYEGLSVKALKEMFDIPKDGEGSYMRKDGHFDRPAFEKRVIQPLCDDLKNCRMINLVMQSDGKMYEKVKQGNRVMGYRFYWTFSARPGVAAADEVKVIQDRVDKDPRVLKVARDIVQGEQRPRRGKKTAESTGIERSYSHEDMIELTRKLAQMN